MAPSEELEQRAQSIASLLLRKYSQTELLGTRGEPVADAAPDNSTHTEDERDLHSVDLNSLKQLDSRTVGYKALAL